MRYNVNRAIALLLACTIVLLVTSAFITSASIIDTDPSTYAVVPILMLPLFIFFSLKSRPEPSVDKKDIVIGAAAFLSFLILSVMLRIYFSFLFVGFRLDMLLMPLALFGLVCLTFGRRSIHKFRGAVMYSLLASPAVLYPIITQSSAFTQFNTVFVYDIVKLFISSAQYIAPITIFANGYNIGIGETCVSIGIFVALALFLIPIAYFYNGKTKDKILWTASGVVILLLLNLIRMLGITFAWFAYGPNSTTLLVHSIIGVLLFYIIIVAMILVAGRYGLSIEKPSKKRTVRRVSKIDAATVVVAILFSFIYLGLTLNYSSALHISPLILGDRMLFNYSNTQTTGTLGGLLHSDNLTYVVLGSQNGTYAIFTITNKTITTNSSLTLFAEVPSSQVLAPSHRTIPCSGSGISLERTALDPRSSTS